MLCTNRPEGFGPRSHLYSHILTSCFLDTILVPLCTWLYLTALLIIIILTATTRKPPHGPSHPLFGNRVRASKPAEQDDGAGTNDEPPSSATTRPTTKTHRALSIIYYLFLLAQFLMCILEIVRLSLTHLGIGLLPFTFVALIAAAAVRLTHGFGGRVVGWRGLNVALWVALAVTNGVKVAEERKEGTGARKGSKYPVADEITDVAVMIGVYAVLVVLEGWLMMRGG